MFIGHLKSRSTSLINRVYLFPIFLIGFMGWLTFKDIKILDGTPCIIDLAFVIEDHSMSCRNLWSKRNCL